jgi:tRNA (guanine-N7-)-methyltransferase
LARLPAGAVSAYHIYFPDPWPKSRHRRRRFVRLEMLRLLHRTLKRGGAVLFATDFFDYYVQAKILLAFHGGFTMLDRLPPAELNVSLFNQRFLQAGKEIFFTTAAKL